ncbi:peptidase domain-containing ABC transporter [Pseudanabaena sp. PCC 6802]|uniref:peptidase domain-containing ABC transporter n=1 Tax=Pseudanabaena sp. PCC 6802 TaxID=118173 RepID=UPI0003452F91|nr:peptidase domain-containing ABC transporter [Pseudanabaena sp. PCC 6802]
MIQPSSTLVKIDIEKHLQETLGQPLSETELAACWQQMQLLEPPAGKLFWQATDERPGVYIVLAGKVRLLDGDNNLVASLEPGVSFGQQTLFPAENFQSYTARASLNLQLAYLPSNYLQSLIGKYPTIGDRLRHQAIVWNFLLCCRQTISSSDIPVEDLLQLLTLLEPQTLDKGELSFSIVQGQQLLLLHQGELLHSSGKRLTVGNLYFSSQLPQGGSWQVTKPTEIYRLGRSEWEMLRQDAPQLATLVSSDRIETELPSRNIAVIEEPERVPPTKISHSDRQSKSQIGKAYFPHPTIKIGHLWQRITHRYPFFRQQSATDCGAACLVMVGRYWGKRFSVNRLREIAHVNRTGASIRSLSAAAESLGFTTRPVKASLDKLAEQNLPAIAHWEGKHYVVVFEITRDRVVVCDPALGQLSLTHAQFKRGWTGYALLLQPTALLNESKEDKQQFWQFWQLVKPHSVVLAEVFIASVLLQIFGLITPLLTQLLLDRVVVQRSSLTLTTVGIGLLFFSLFRVVMTSLRQYLLDHTANKVDLVLLIGFISHTFRLPLGFFESRFVGDIISRVQENRKIQRFLTGEALSIVLDLLTVFIYVGLMLWYSWQMALLTLAIVPLFMLLSAISTPLLQKVSREIFTAYNEETGYLIQSLNGVRTVKSMAVEQNVRWHWEELFNRSVKANFNGQTIGNAMQTASLTIEALITTILLWFGAWQVIQNNLTIGQLVAFNMLLGNVIRPFQRLTVLWNELQEVVIAVERINDVIDTAPEEDLLHQTRQTLPPINGYIQFDRVTFRYHPDSDINTLENLSFSAQPGQMVALVGRSGSGKTTIAKLLLGLYSPTEGKILIDGYDVSGLSLRSLRQQIGVVDQDTFLFGGTIRENICISHPEAKLDDIIEAAKQAGAHQFIKELPMGYETQIGEGGGMLSGGQRQRLAIARALLGNPRLLILDEATSSLDAESERIIQSNFNTILKNRTTLVIAHRLSTVRNADLILVLDRGVLVESGTHEQLMSQRGHYFYLNQQQLAIVS